MKFVITWIFKTVVGRWVTAGVITLLLGGVVTWWYSFKSDLRDEGEQKCVQLINEETMLQLQAALVDSQAARAELQARLEIAARVNQDARIRRNMLERRLLELDRQRLQQKENDNAYRTWNDTALPSGVADRLRDAKAGAHKSAVRENSN